MNFIIYITHSFSIYTYQTLSISFLCCNNYDSSYGVVKQELFNVLIIIAWKECDVCKYKNYLHDN